MEARNFKYLLKNKGAYTELISIGPKLAQISTNLLSKRYNQLLATD